jgi:hypothetical protein
MGELLYGQVIKHQRRRKDSRSGAEDAGRGAGRVSKDAEGKRAERADQHFVYREIEFDDSTVRLKTDAAVYTSELVEHLEWWRVFYHFVRFHESLEVKLGEPIARKGKRQPQRYKNHTPAMAAGLAGRRLKVKELLLMPLP